MVSELLPHMSAKVDEIALVKSMHTEAINHDPAITYICTGHQLPGKASLGAWLSYGLGTESENLPAFLVMTATWTGRKEAQALYNRLWGSGFLPSKYQGVALRSSGDPVLYLSNPAGVDAKVRRRMLDSLASAESDHRRKNWRSRDERADRAIRNGVQDADQRAGTDQHQRRTTIHSGSVWSRRNRARHVCQLLFAVPPDGRAGCPVHPDLSSRLGPARQSAWRSCPTNVAMSTNRRPLCWRTCDNAACWMTRW